jgi:UDP-N-acetylglucosamine 1-carboxyvinyltransferase
MSAANEKIGRLIAHVRQERGLTQAELAKKLKTSQSAVNRIEKGKQNVSLETLGRVSDVLNKQIISINDKKSINLRVEGPTELSGSIALKRSKNAAVALLCASLLNHGVTRFKAFPRIEEVFRIIEVLESIGVKVKWLPGNDLEIHRPKNLDLASMNAVSARKTRSVLMLLGPLMHEFKTFRIPYAGGCKLGARTVIPHLFAIEQFGVDVAAKTGFYNVNVKKRAAKHVTLYEAGNTVTNNTLMAAAGTSETTIIQGASADYMVQDLCAFLIKLGVKIEGIGSPVLKVTGVPHIKKNITFAPTEDPIEAMFFISAAITTNSKLTLQRVPLYWIGLELLKLKKMGLDYTQTETYPSDNGVTELADITIHKHNGKLKAPVEKLHPNLWPGINPDNIPYFVPICGTAKGRTLIHDWIFENRAIYYTEMTKVGMSVELADPHRLYITGPTQFTHGDVVCPPALRPASLLLIGMLAAKGTSTLRNVYTINRGYEDLAERLNSIGAKITVYHEL